MSRFRFHAAISLHGRLCFAAGPLAHAAQTPIPGTRVTLDPLPGVRARGSVSGPPTLRPLVRAGDAVTRADPRRAQRSFQSAPARESGRCASFSRSRFEAAKSLGSANRVCQSMFEGSMEANGATSRKRINVLQNARTSAVRRTCCGFAQRIRLPAALRSRSIEIGRIA